MKKRNNTLIPKSISALESERTVHRISDKSKGFFKKYQLPSRVLFSRALSLGKVLVLRPCSSAVPWCMRLATGGTGDSD
jgi:hypothetical protein